MVGSSCVSLARPTKGFGLILRSWHLIINNGRAGLAGSFYFGPLKVLLLSLKVRGCDGRLAETGVS